MARWNGLMTVGPGQISADKTHDCDEGVDGVEESFVAIRLSLQVFYGSLQLQLVEEMRYGGELVARSSVLRKALGAIGFGRCHGQSLVGSQRQGDLLLYSRNKRTRSQTGTAAHPELQRMFKAHSVM